MEKHIIFSDVDGTLYDRDHKIHPQTLKDIKFAQDKGVEFAICTGNAALKGQNMMSLASELDARYIISSNGASLYDAHKEEFIHVSSIPQDKCQSILDFAIETGASGLWWDTKGIWSTPGASEKLIEAASWAILTNGFKIESSDKVFGDVLKIEFYDTPKKIDLIQKKVEELKLQGARMKPEHIEITHTGVSKGHGVQKLCELLDVKTENTMGIGDSANDLGMFNVVGHSYAMDNASKEVKKAAMHYTSDVKQNGLGEAIIDYLYRTKLDR